MQIQISWLLKKPTDLDLHCLLRQGAWCSAREGLIAHSLCISPLYHLDMAGRGGQLDAWLTGDKEVLGSNPARSGNILSWRLIMKYFLWSLTLSSAVSRRQLPVSGERMGTITTVLLTSLGKTFFAWRFILNENILFWMTIFYQKPFVISVCVLFSNIHPKIKFMANNWSDLCNFYSKVIFLNFWLRK